MASSINASTAGAGGVITTADNSGVLNLQSGGTNIAIINPTGMSATSISTNNTFGFKNRIINGDFQIAQRGTSVTVPAGNILYTLDRWTVGTNTTSMTMTQGTQTTYPFTYSVLSGVAGNTGISISQRIESKNIQDLAGYAVTLSFFFYNASGNAPSGSLTVTTPTAVDNYASTTTILNQAIGVNSSVKQTVTFTLPASAANGLQIIFGTPSLTSGSLVLFGVQLEAGSQATSYDVRSIGQELFLCQRYFEKSYAQGVSPGTNTGVGVYYGSFNAGYASSLFYVQFAAEKRTSPTMLGYTTGGVSGNWFDTSVGNLPVVIANQSTRGGGSATVTGGAGAAQFGQWTASAEL
jgi:hypothetical protein